MKTKTVLITGSTAGIGKACAEKLASEGYRLIITGRRKKILEELAFKLNQEYKSEVQHLSFDIRNLEETQKAIDSLDENWKNIDILVNNAGLAPGLQPVHEGDIEDWDSMIDTNIKGLLYITRIIAPIMIENNGGHIINIGSIAGKEVYPNGNVYSATKHAVDALTKGMRLDFLKHGIKVSQVAPGAVETEFSMVRFKGDEVMASKVYRGYEPLLGTDIANAVSYIINQPAHVCINDLVIMPFAQANATTFNKET